MVRHTGTNSYLYTVYIIYVFHEEKNFYLKLVVLKILPIITQIFKSLLVSRLTRIQIYKSLAS